jgi:hypothetical protein
MTEKTVTAKPLGTGGRLYKDAREKEAKDQRAAEARAARARLSEKLGFNADGTVREDEDSPAEAELPVGADRPETQPETQEVTEPEVTEPEVAKPEVKPEKPAEKVPPQQPAWGKSGLANVPEPETSKPPDFRGIFSTMTELVGIGALSFGFWLHAAWLGFVALGVCLILTGIALGIPPGRPIYARRTTRRRQRKAS